MAAKLLIGLFLTLLLLLPVSFAAQTPRYFQNL